MKTVSPTMLYVSGPYNPLEPSTLTVLSTWCHPLHTLRCALVQPRHIPPTGCSVDRVVPSSVVRVPVGVESGPPTPTAARHISPLRGRSQGRRRNRGRNTQQ